jgi:hypothetical protein
VAVVLGEVDGFGLYLAENLFDRLPGAAVSDCGVEGFMRELRVNEHSHV